MGIIRFLLAIAVVTSHSNQILGSRFISGSIAVQSFFIISGFYISLILNEKYTDKNKSYVLYITNRILRILPLYWTVLFCIVCLSVCIGLISNGETYFALNQIFAISENIKAFFLAMLTNVFVVGQDIIMFLNLEKDTNTIAFTGNFTQEALPLYVLLLIPQAWSLSIEILYYTIAPLLVRRKIFVICIIIFLSLMLRLYIYNILNLKNDPWTYRFFPTELMFFLFGSISYSLYKFIAKKSLYYTQIFLLCTTCMLTIFFGYIPKITTPYSHFTINEITYLLLLTSAVPFLFILTKNTRIDRTIGELSYPIYLVHVCIITIVSKQQSIISSPLCIILISTISALLLHYIVAKPIERYRQSRLLV
jgi:peptidoglycan/LPS O-acetylase OafA/YrhL